MNWMLVLILVIACSVCAMLGLAAGVNLNPASTVKFVWDWNAAGSWVSGVGALAAVLVTLWQIRRQQEREKPKLFVQQDCDLGERSFSLTLVSTGLVPATVLGAHLSYDGGHVLLDLSLHLAENTTFPQRLDRGEVMTLLTLKNVSFYMLGRKIVGPLASALRSRGEKAAVHGEGINERYFDELNLISSRGATLVVKTAYGVDEFDFSKKAFSALTKYAIDDERLQASNQLDHWVREDRKLAKELAAAHPDWNQ